MYLLRRIWKCKPGEARRVASLVQKQAQIYHDAGHRSEFQVYFNGYTPPPIPTQSCWSGPTGPEVPHAPRQRPAQGHSGRRQVRELTEGPASRSWSL